jgi:hypothetical protein
MGVVYRARQTALKRVVALKMILAGAHAGPDDLARFRTEAEAAARMQHPNIVQIYEVGERDGRPYFSMEFVEGGCLATRLDGRPWDSREAAALVEVLAQTMHYAHERGVVHRDLKPANILLALAGGPDSSAPGPARSRGFIPKIADFGLAKRLEEGMSLTQTGAVLGTPSYMAPEQATGRSRAIGPATDVYALGAVCYELLAGRPPFQAATRLDTVLQVLSEEPVPPRQPNPRVDPDLELICLKCLAKDPHERYASAAALAEDLNRFLAGDHPVHAHPLDEWELAVRWARKFWITAILTVVAVSLMLLVYLVGAAFGVAHRSIEYLALTAWVPGSLATLAILVRPRRWVVCATGLFLVVALGLPWVAWAILGGPTGGDFRPANQASPSAFDVALSVVAGVIPAGVLGGVSRGIARRCRCDMLSVLFGGIVGAAATTVCCSCSSSVLFMIWTRQAPLGQAAVLATFAMMLVWILGSLLGFCSGALLVARISRRRLDSGWVADGASPDYS